jgi:ABC-type antimicrobial peptide transport system ATPase subunit
MKFRLQELVISEDEGFDAKKDIFHRKTFGENLANVYSNTDEELVIALNGGWGEGKSTFVHMWRGHVKNREQDKLHTIYFDAFKNDFQKDAFLAIASEIHARIPSR